MLCRFPDAIGLRFSVADTELSGHELRNQYMIPR
jgi:hypothetical protein